MITFFKKTRKQLADNNKTVKYLRYALGEIVLVVVGILIALQINNWNIVKVKEKTLSLYLSNLVNNLQSDIETMKSLEDINTFRYYSLQYLLEMVEQSPVNSKNDNLPPFNINTIWEKPLPKAYDKEFTELAFFMSHRPGYIVLNQSVIDELKSTGMFSEIKSMNLKQDINNYYRFWQSTIGDPINREKNIDLISSWDASLGDDGILTEEIYNIEDPLVLLQNNLNEYIY